MKRIVCVLSMLIGVAIGYSLRDTRVAYAEAEEKFTPPDLTNATMVACGVGGDKRPPASTVRVFVQVDYRGGGHYVPTIAVRDSVANGLKDCVWWDSNLIKLLEKDPKEVKDERTEQ